jgi:hypothetical protein
MLLPLYLLSAASSGLPLRTSSLLVGLKLVVAWNMAR